MLHPGALSAEQHSEDSDRDGLSDQAEDALLKKFVPIFMISRDDCSVRPARFIAEEMSQTISEDDGTIYGQAFSRRGHEGEVELHYYHLWRKDCGQMGHRLDAEHVSVLVHTDAAGRDAGALYWYAAAHEDTVCDASQLTWATTLDAEKRGDPSGRPLKLIVGIGKLAVSFPAKDIPPCPQCFLRPTLLVFLS